MLLHHGTTKIRAQSILNNGPNVRYVEPGAASEDVASEFHVAPADGPFDCGSPEDYARRQAALFPSEGGPAILEFELNDELANGLIGQLENDTAGKACNWGSDIWFQPGYGLDELLAVWDDLPKHVILL